MSTLTQNIGTATNAEPKVTVTFNNKHERFSMRNLSLTSM